MTTPSNHLRSLSGHLRVRHERQATRRLGVAKILRETPNATNIELAKMFDVDRDTIAEDRKFLMVQVNQDAKTETQQLREEQLAELADLKIDLSDPLIKPDRKIELALAIVDRVIKLTGTAAPTKTVSARVAMGNEVTQGFYIEFARRTMKLKHDSSWQKLWDFIDSMPDDYAEEERLLLEGSHEDIL